MHKVKLCLILLVGNLPAIAAYSQFIPPNVPLNNLVAESVYNFGHSNTTGTSADTNAPAPASFITDSDASLEFDYTYSRQWARVPGPVLPGGLLGPPYEMVTKINDYNAAPSLFFDIRSNLLVTAGFDYLHEDISINNGTSGTFDDYTPFVSADEELLHLLPQIDTTRNSLFLGGNFYYTRAISSENEVAVSGLPGGGYTTSAPAGITYNNYSFGPSLVYIRSLADWSDGTPGRASFTVNPAYSYNYDQAPFGLERNGVVSVLGRVDYGLARNLYLNVSGTWMHRNYIGHPSPPNEDWALFGGGLTARILSQSNHLVLVRVAYSYQAFITGFEAHEVSAQLEFHF